MKWTENLYGLSDGKLGDNGECFTPLGLVLLYAQFGQCRLIRLSRDIKPIFLLEFLESSSCLLTHQTIHLDLKTGLVKCLLEIPDLFVRNGLYLCHLLDRRLASRYAFFTRSGFFSRKSY